MNKKIADLQSKIYYAREIIPIYEYNWGDALYETYKAIIEDINTINEDDAKDVSVFRIHGKNIFHFSQDLYFLNELKQRRTITSSSREQVINKLNNLCFAIRIATE